MVGCNPSGWSRTLQTANTDYWTIFPSRPLLCAQGNKGHAWRKKGNTRQNGRKLDCLYAAPCWFNIETNWVAQCFMTLPGAQPLHLSTNSKFYCICAVVRHWQETRPRSMLHNLLQSPGHCHFSDVGCFLSNQHAVKKLGCFLKPFRNESIKKLFRKRII